MSARSNLTNALAFAALVFILVLVLGRCSPVRAADEETCRVYSQDVEKLVKQLTDDIDVAQAARFSGYKWCVWSATEPPEIRIATADERTLSVPKNVAPVETTPREAMLPTPVVDPLHEAWIKACKKRYRTFRSSDETVIPSGKRKRVRCPI